jgi:integrase
MVIHRTLQCDVRWSKPKKESKVVSRPKPKVIRPVKTQPQKTTWDIDVEVETKGKKARRASRRKAAEEEPSEIGRLRSASVSKVTRERYTSVFKAMEDYARQWRLKMETAAQTDATTASYLEHLYMDGEDTSMGNYVVAALCFHRPELKGNQDLPKTMQALRGWRKLSPPRSRMPIPYEVVALLATRALTQGLEEVALVLLLNFYLYLRPSEYRGLRVRDVVKPVKKGPGAYKWWSFLLHPTEVGIPSKTEQWDESLTLDLPYQRFLGLAIFERMRLRLKGKNEAVFTVTPNEINSFLEQCWEPLGLGPIGKPHLYRLRHGGASHEAANHMRSLTAIQVRGRWQSIKSVKNYEKGSRVAQLFASLDSKVQKECLVAAKRLKQTFLNQR